MAWQRRGRKGGGGNLRLRCAGQEGLQVTSERPVNMRTEKTLAIQGHRCHVPEHGLYRDGQKPDVGAGGQDLGEREPRGAGKPLEEGW